MYIWWEQSLCFIIHYSVTPPSTARGFSALLAAAKVGWDISCDSPPLGTSIKHHAFPITARQSVLLYPLQSYSLSLPDLLWQYIYCVRQCCIYSPLCMLIITTSIFVRALFRSVWWSVNPLQSTRWLQGHTKASVHSVLCLHSLHRPFWVHRWTGFMRLGWNLRVEFGDGQVFCFEPHDTNINILEVCWSNSHAEYD